MTTRYREPPSFLKEELYKIANYLMTHGKGILGLDQSPETMGIRDLQVENTQENRRKFREIVILADDDLANYFSGIIFPTDAFYDLMPSGETIVQCLKKKGIVCGVKLDKGLLPLIGSEGECTTSGISDLEQQCQFYKSFECHFAKWRCVYRVGDNLPSSLAIFNNAEILARFANVCQYHRLVPIIEPEILPEGKHTLLRAQKIAETVFSALIKSLNNHHIYLEGVILKINFVTPGMQGRSVYTPAEIAATTLTVLNRTIPAALAGIVFLAGGSCEDEATAFLDAINQPIGRRPWPLSFSFARGMLHSVMHTWAGDEDKVEDARKVLMQRAKSNNWAALGEYVLKKEKMLQKLKKEEEKRKALLGFEHNKKLKTHAFNDKTEDSDESAASI
uniref:fructose-bisphosphate aldolase n=1 Tax=Rhodnius prolixus TaxID=13249 RepID=R4G3Z6_RHOPR